MADRGRDIFLVDVLSYNMLYIGGRLEITQLIQDDIVVSVLPNINTLRLKLKSWKSAPHKSTKSAPRSN